MDKGNRNDNQDEATFEQVNDMLQDNQQVGTNRQVQVLTFKLNQLQKICANLTRTNKILMERVEQLEQQLQNKSNATQPLTFNQDYSQMQGDVTDIEQLVKQYRIDCEKYQSKMSQQLKEKTQAILTLQANVTELKEVNEDFMKRVEELQYENTALTQTKQNLLLQIEDLETNLRRSKFQSPRGTKQRLGSYLQGYGYQSERGDFNMNVQQQLQKLIEKLIKELQHQRSIKKKLNEEIKNLQKDMVDLQKEIMAKNNKIYALQLTVIKKGKPQTSISPISSKHVVKQQVKGREGRQVTSRHVKSNRSFSMMELMNDGLELSSKDKLILALKIIDLYIRKLENKDYTSNILESLHIYGYTPANPNLMTIRVSRQESDGLEDYERSQEEVIWNLAFVLDNLFTQSIDRDKDFGQSSQEGELLQMVTIFLQNKQKNSFYNVVELRKLVEQAITFRKQ